MNIFVLDNDPVLAAQAQCDRHVPKMVLESAQLLCGAFPRAPYRRTHLEHPCTVWTRTTFGNFHWLYQHAQALAEEYTFRFGREHASAQVISWCWEQRAALALPKVEPTAFVQAMPMQYRGLDPVEAYRAYYRGEKTRFARWEHGRHAPEWWI